MGVIFTTRGPSRAIAIDRGATAGVVERTGLSELKPLGEEGL